MNNFIRTDYNSIASGYNKRYEINQFQNISKILSGIIKSISKAKVLEAGCGTGYWLNLLRNHTEICVGLDYSFEMLKVAKSFENNSLINGNAVYLPFKSDYYDIVFCINAIHHFPDKLKFLKECFRVLKKDGIILLFGVDPYIDQNWYVYDFFDGVLENDLKRFPSFNDLINLAQSCGFTQIDFSVAETVYHNRIGNKVFEDSFLKKEMSSQLANLSSEEYERGLNKIREKIETKPDYEFITDLQFYLLKAKKG